MDVGEARTMLRSAIRDGESSDQFSDFDIDVAIQYAGSHFCRETRVLKQVDSVTITADSSDFPLTAPLADGFAPERVLAVFIPGQEEPLSIIDVVNFESIRAANTQQGKPCYLAFTSLTTAQLFPTPTESTTAKLIWYLPFTDWDAGDEDDTTELNLSKEHMLKVINDGAAAIAKAPSPEDAFKTISWQRFDTYCKSQRGAGAVSPIRTFMIQPISPQQYRTLRRLDQSYENLY